MNSDPEEDRPVGELPEEIGEAASDGDFERVKSWLSKGQEKPRKTQGSLLGVLVDHLLQFIFRLARLDRYVVARIQHFSELVPLG